MTNQLSILFMDSGDSGQGGSFVSLLQLVTLFASHGHRTHVVLWSDSPYISQYQQQGANVVIIDHPFYSKKRGFHRYVYNKCIAFCMRFSQHLIPVVELILQWNCYRFLTRYVTRHQITIIHTNNQPVRNFIGFWVAKKMKRPLVAHVRTLHGYGFTQAHVNFIRQLDCRLIAVSHSAADYWKKMGVPADAMITMPNPYDGELSQEIQAKTVEKRLVYVGRLESGKGLEFLLESFSQLVKQDGAFTLSLIGDGSKKRELMQHCLALGIEKQVRFLGYIYDAKRLLSQFDVLIFASAQEGFGRVVVEAMAKKLPVVATRVSGIIDIVRHQYNGLLVDYGNQEQLVAAILRLYQDQALCKQLVENGYRTVVNEFSVSNYYQQLYDIYRGLTIRKNDTIAIVISDLGAGGSQRVLVNLLQLWQETYRMAVITLAGTENDFFQLPKTVTRYVLGGVAQSKHPIAGLLANSKRIALLRRALREIKPRVVLSFICPTNILTVLATRGLNTNVIISERNDPQRQSFGWIWNQLRFIFYRFADRVTANTKGALETMRAYVPQRKLCWVPNPLIPPINAADFFIFEKPTILAVGRLHAQKAYDILLRAFAQFAREFPQWQLAILGDGALKNDLQQLAAQLAIDHAVIWYGNVQNSFRFYQAASLFVMASRHEGMPNSLLEAMFFGLPIIVTNASPGPLEYIQDQVNGLVVESENIEALTHAMKTLAIDPLKRKQLAQQAARTIQMNSVDEVIKKWSEVLTFES